MATVPYFLVSPKVVLSLLGLVKERSSREQAAVPATVDATVDVVIPARNEEATISLSLASLENQTFRPRRVVVVDDASEDRTFEIAEDFAALSDLDITVSRRDRPEGKTPGVKEVAYSSDADGIFVLDADTVLMSDNYLQTMVTTLFERRSVASVSGMILPLRDRDRRRYATTEPMRRFLHARPGTPFLHDRTLAHRLLRGITNIYREVLYYFTQNVVYRGEIDLFGTIMNTVGCGVLYRREYLVTVMDEAESQAGDDLTESEDIFFGFSFVDRGFRNIQNLSVLLRSEEPEAQNVPEQVVHWSSAWFQSAYYFPELVASPFKALRRWWLHFMGAHPTEERRVHPDAWRQPFGRDHARREGRPAGWMVLLALFEKVSFPLVLVALALMGRWDILVWTFTLETALMVVLVAAFGQPPRLHYVGMTLVVTPLRYGTILFDVVTVSRFLLDLLKPGRKHWRK